MANKGCCIEWEQEIILLLDNELPEGGRPRVEKHLRQCKYCASLYHEMERENQLIGGRLRHLAEVNLPNKLFTDSIMDALPTSGVATLQGKTKEWFRQINEVYWRPARLHLAVAASFLVCILSLMAVFKMDVEPMEAFIRIHHNSVVRDLRLREPIIVKSEKGEFFDLPDGSLAYATQGTIFYIESYQQDRSEKRVGSDRRIHLITGELFFDVQPANEGFNVLCSNARTTVVGTKFYVGYLPGQRRQSIVAVLEGQVYVEKIGKNQLGSTILNMRQMTHVVTNEGKVTLQPPKEVWAVLFNRLNDFEKSRTNHFVSELLSQPGFNIANELTAEPVE